jgi:hypothetical protein
MLTNLHQKPFFFYENFEIYLFYEDYILAEQVHVIT